MTSCCRHRFALSPQSELLNILRFHTIQPLTPYRVLSRRTVRPDARRGHYSIIIHMIRVHRVSSILNFFFYRYLFLLKKYKIKTAMKWLIVTLWRRLDTWTIRFYEFVFSRYEKKIWYQDTYEEQTVIIFLWRLPVELNNLFATSRG